MTGGLITGVPEPEDDVTDWLLTTAERDNPATDLPAWTEGNLAEPLVHGAAYFDRLVDAVRDLEAGDHLFFTDWRGDPDQKLRPDGPPSTSCSPTPRGGGSACAGWCGGRTGTG